MTPSSDERRYRQIALGQLKQAAAGENDSIRLKVISDSMAPLLRPGDYILARPAQPSELRCGDLIVVQRDGELITHRLVSVDGEGWHTKGDRLSTADRPVPAQDIVGVVTAVVRQGRYADLRTRRWQLANRILGWSGRWEARLFWWAAGIVRQPRVPEAQAVKPRRWLTALAALAALPFRCLNWLLVMVLALTRN